MSEEQVIVRPFEEKDGREVAEIVVSSFESKFMALIPLPRERLADVLIDSNIVAQEPFEGYVVAEVNGKCVGVMLLKWKTQQREKRKPYLYWFAIKYGLAVAIQLWFGIGLLGRSVNGSECYIEHIAVSSNARGMGIGTLLLQYGEQIARDLPGIQMLSLYVANNNPKAFQLYERQSFRLKAEVNSPLTGRLFDVDKWLYMTKSL